MLTMREEAFEAFVNEVLIDLNGTKAAIRVATQPGPRVSKPTVYSTSRTSPPPSLVAWHSERFALILGRTRCSPSSCRDRPLCQLPVSGRESTAV